MAEHTAELTREQKLDKWGAGPWLDEPDRIEWRHKAVPCLMKRNHMGVWCGYAAAEPGHPWHGQPMGDLEGNIAVHGDVSYAAACAGEICHVPLPGEPDDVWWVGFDCGHAWDAIPTWTLRYADFGQVQGAYRDQHYVRREVERLAEQLIAARTKGCK